jgi:hypothetical protein
VFSPKAVARFDGPSGGAWIRAFAGAVLLIGLGSPSPFARPQEAEASPPRVSSQGEPTEPVEASLIVHLDAPVGIGGPDSPIFLRVGAIGPPFPGTVTLRDEAGVNVAYARAIHPGSRCRRLPRHLAVRDIPRGAAASRHDWCLKISGLEIGSEVSGELPGSDTALTLTLAARHNFFFLPFLFTLMGGAAAVGAAFVTRWLRRYLRETHIDLLVHRNRRSRSRRVEGLWTWVATMRRRRVPDEDLAQVVERVVEDGPERMQAARSLLNDHLRSSGIPTESPLYASARREAQRKDYAIGDFVDPNGKEKQLPADAWVESVKRAVHLAGQIQEAEGETQRLPRQANTELLKSLAVMRTMWAEAKDDEDLTELEQAMQEFRPRLQRAMESQAVLRSDGGSAERLLLPPPPPQPSLPAPAAPQGPHRRRRLLAAALLGGVLVAATLVVATPTFLGLRGPGPAAPAPPPEQAGGEPDGADGAPPPPEVPPTPTGTTPSVPGSNGDGQSPAPSPLPSPVPTPRTSLPAVPIAVIAGALLAIGLVVPLFFGRIAFAIAITGELIILAAAAFIATVAVTTYAPNATFGRLSDYFTLATAATSSGALGGVFGMLTYWKATGQGTR